MKLLPAIASLSLASAFPITEFHHTIESPVVKETPTLQEQYNDEMSIDLNNLISSVDATLKNLMSIPILSMDVWHMPNGETSFGDLPKSNVFRSMFPSKRMFSPIESGRFVDIDTSEDNGETTFKDGKTTTKHDYVKKVLDTLTGKINEEHVVSTDIDDGVHNIMHSEVRTSSDNTQTSSFTSSSFSNFNNIKKIDDSFNWLMDKRDGSINFLENNVEQNDDSDEDSDEEYSDSELDLLDDSDLDSDDEQMLDEDGDIDVFDDEEVDPNSVVMKVTNNKIKELEDRIASLRKVQSDIQSKINKNEVEDDDEEYEDEDDYEDDEDDYEDDEENYEDEDDYEDDDYEEEDYDDENDNNNEQDFQDLNDHKDDDYNNVINKNKADSEIKDEEYDNSIFENDNENDYTELSKVADLDNNKKEPSPKSAVKIIKQENEKVNTPEKVVSKVASATKIVEPEESMEKTVAEVQSANKVVEDKNSIVDDDKNAEFVVAEKNSIKESESIEEEAIGDSLKDTDVVKPKITEKITKPSKKLKSATKLVKESNKTEKVKNQKKGKKQKSN